MSPSTPFPPIKNSSIASFRGQSAQTISICTISPSCRRKVDAWSESRLCCAGTTQRAARSRRRRSFLSPLQVRDGTIVELVRSALAECSVSPSRLVLEITEGVLIDNPDEMVKRIKDLHELGVRVALDDFGSGYSNLGYLQRFPLDKIKIDQSFVAALGRSANGSVIIQAMVALGRALGLSVLVEGVETEHQRVLLRLAGCDEMQGFLFAKPAPARVIDGLMAHPSRKVAGRAVPEPLTA